jgi:AcrR family transcriptional regulator
VTENGAGDGRGTRMRADARRNRDQIAKAARGIFAEQGVDVPMEEIARRAGVGVGTLYRNFPDRDALIEAVAVDGMRLLIEVARSSRDREAEPWQVLRSVLRRSIELRLGWLHSALQPRLVEAIRNNRELREARRILFELVEELVRDSQAAGAIRDDVRTADVVLIFGLVSRPLPAVPTELADTARVRMLEIALEGLRPNPARPLPGRAISMRELTVGWPDSAN